MFRRSGPGHMLLHTFNIKRYNYDGGGDDSPPQRLGGVVSVLATPCRRRLPPLFLDRGPRLPLHRSWPLAASPQGGFEDSGRHKDGDRIDPIENMLNGFWSKSDFRSWCWNNVDKNFLTKDLCPNTPAVLVGCKSDLRTSTRLQVDHSCCCDCFHNTPSPSSSLSLSPSSSLSPLISPLSLSSENHAKGTTSSIHHHYPAKLAFSHHDHHHNQ